MILSSYSIGKSVFQLIGVLLIFLFVLVITYLTTKWLANYQQGQSQNQNIKVMETCRVTNNKYIQIIKTGSEYLVIAVCKDSITLLTKLQEDQLETFGDPKLNNKDVFKEILNKLKNHPKPKE